MIYLCIIDIEGKLRRSRAE